MAKKTNHDWTTTEVKTLQNGKLPEGRTYHAIQQFCSRNHIKFPGKRYRKQNNLDFKTVCFVCKKECSEKNEIKIIGGIIKRYACDECFKTIQLKRNIMKEVVKNGR